MKNTIISLILVAGTAFFVSCKDDDNGSKGNVQLIVKSSLTKPAKSNGLKSPAYQASSLELTSFKVNIAEIEFGIDEDAEGLSGEVLDSIVDAQELNGPFLVDLLSKQALDGLNLGGALIPNAIYEEVEFEFDRCTTNTNTEMFGNSIVITGTINGKPMKFWTNEEIEFEVEFPDQTSFTVTDNNLKVYLDFSIGQVVSSLSTFDLSSAVDGNKNGTIEIGPNDTDGNNKLAHYLAESLEGAFDLDRDND